MDNRRIAAVLGEIGDILDIKGENSFRIRSYRMAAESIENHGADVAEMVRKGADLRALPGVGEGIAAKIKEIVEKGDCTYHAELLSEVPADLLELLEIPGLGPKGVSLVWRKLGVTSADALEAAIRDGRFRTLPGMKEKKEARILKGLEDRRTAEKRFLLPVAAQAAVRLGAYLREHGADRVEPAGSFRRRRETIGDVDLIVLGPDPQALADSFVRHPDVKQVLSHAAGKSSVVLTSGLQVDYRHFEESSLGAALHYFTGSKAHNVALRGRAVKRGLVDEGQIRGDLHAHTTESDGRDSLEDMARAARARGLGYLALTEHSRAIPSPTNGTGMDEARCLAHIARIREQQKRVPDLRLLAGIEVDILPDGRLDMADDVLAQLDVVVASLHSRLDMERGQMTDRMLRALENPHVDVWGHPLARRLLQRDAVALDFEPVVREAARRGVALEINSQPQRLDLPDHLIRTAREAGVRFVISTDSHATTQLDNLTWGVGIARRGWLTAADVLNTLGADALLAALRRPVSR